MSMGSTSEGGAGGAGGEASGAGGAGSEASGAGASTEASVGFTQDQLNERIEAERAKFASHAQKLNDELNAIRTRANLSDSEREDLDKRLEELQTKLLTKEELARREQQKLRMEHEATVKELSQEKAQWQKRFTESTISRALTDAAASNNAFHPSQIVAILGPKVELREEDGKFNAIAMFDDKNDKGEAITLELSVPDAVKRMKDIDIYKNLFKDSGVGGLGGSSGSGKQTLDIAKLAQDPAAYRKARAEGKIQLS